MVNVGSGNDVAASLLMHTLPENGTPPPAAPDAEPEGGRRRGRSQPQG
jgi:hypothetical protein